MKKKKIKNNYTVYRGACFDNTNHYVCELQEAYDQFTKQNREI